MDSDRLRIARAAVEQLALSLAAEPTAPHELAAAVERYQLEHLHVDGLAAATIAWRESTCAELVARFGQRDIAGRWRDAAGLLYRELGECRASMCCNTLGRILNLARSWGWREHEHDLRGLCRIRSARRTRVVHLPERLALVRVLERFDERARQHVAAEVVRYALWSGWRVSECCGIEWIHVAPDFTTVHLPWTKARKAQTRAIGPEAALVLRRQPRVGRFVFSNRRGDRPLNRRQPQEIMRRACEAAGIDRASLHTLRHTRATIGAQLQLPTANLSLALGHTTTWQTTEYQHVDVDAVREAARRIDAEILKGGAA